MTTSPPSSSGIGSVQRLGDRDGSDMTGRVVAGWGIVDEVGSAVGRNGGRRPGTECSGAGDQPAQRPWRYRESGADVA
jgi:hypothetical protein